MTVPTLHQPSKHVYRIQKLEGKLFPNIYTNSYQRPIQPRCLFLARCYAPVKKYPEALTLIQHANINIRETLSSLSLSASDPINASKPAYFSLDPTNIKDLEAELSTDSHAFKRAWFTYNGGAVKEADGQKFEKPLFFNIALNYVELDMDRLAMRAGRQVEQPKVEAVPVAVPQPVKQVPAPKKKVEEVRPETPEPAAPARSGLSSLLGGWWGRS